MWHVRMILFGTMLAVIGPLAEATAAQAQRPNDSGPIRPATPRSTSPLPPALDPTSGIDYSRPVSSPLLVVPEGPEEEGPPDGLTLDAAIATLLRSSPVLRVHASEMMMARADALQSRLPKNPFIFLGVEGIPYDEYREGKPGEIIYNFSLVVPVSVTGVYRKMGQAGVQGVRVIEAKYSDEVRREIDQLYGDWIDVLRARETVRIAQATVDHLDQVLAAARDHRAPRHRDALEIERELIAFLAEEEQGKLELARHRLAELLYLPPETASQIRLNDWLHRRFAPPDDEALIAIAMQHRPDLALLRRDIALARLDVDVARAAAIPTMYPFYAPSDYKQHPIEHEEDSVIWGSGVLFPLPIINRNQGNIRHATLNVSQVEHELEMKKRRVVLEVQQVAEEVRGSRRDLDRLEHRILPMVRTHREHARDDYLAGNIDDERYLEHLQRYQTVVLEYRETLVRHRRSMLHLNTVVGMRIAP